MRAGCAVSKLRHVVHILRFIVAAMPHCAIEILAALDITKAAVITDVTVSDGGPFCRPQMTRHSFPR